MVKFSFIIPVYACEAWLEECVTSILHQTCNESYEIILVNDGSADRSGEIADRLASSNPAVRAFHKPNGGAASARNYGISKAIGEYLLFVDGDDTLGEGLLQNVNVALQKDPNSLVLYGMSFDYYRNGSLARRECLCCAREGKVEKEELCASFAEFFRDNALSSSCNKVFRRDMIEQAELRFREGMTLYEDFDFVLRYLPSVRSCVFLNKPFYHYRNDLDRPHVHNRVTDLKKLRGNLRHLLESSELLYRAFQGLPGARQVMDIPVNLYIQLLEQHLMTSRDLPAELGASIADYLSEQRFRDALTVGQLNGREMKLLRRCDAGEYAGIFEDFRKRRRISALKRMIKAVLRKAGLKK